MDYLTPKTLFCTVIGFSLLEFLWLMYLSYRQFRVMKTTRKVPDIIKSVMNQETFLKAREYAMSKLKFVVLKTTVSITVSSLGMYYEILSKLWFYLKETNEISGEIMMSCSWMFALLVLQMLIEIPLTIYASYVIQDPLGLNTMPVIQIIVNIFVAYTVSMVFVLPTTALMVAVIKYGGKYFFLWLWLSIVATTLIMAQIYPLLAPQMEHYEPLPEGELRTQIESLASQLDFPLTQLYVVEAENPNEPTNAYFFGFLNSKCIVLCNALKKHENAFNNDEILAVIAHELGHWQHSHVPKYMVIILTNYFIMFYIFGMTIHSPLVYEIVGFSGAEQPVLVGLLVVINYILMPYNTFVTFALNMISRHFEYQADKFAANLGKAVHLKAALMKLYAGNLEFPVFDALYSTWFHSHPQLLDRLSALDEINRKL